MATTPVSKYESIEEWYKEFKKQMRKEIKKD
jgi:ribosomal protein S21